MPFLFWPRSLAAIFMLAAVSRAAEIHVAPDGKPGGDGSIRNPYDIFSVFAGENREDIVGIPYRAVTAGFSVRCHVDLGSPANCCEHEDCG